MGTCQIEWKANRKSKQLTNWIVLNKFRFVCAIQGGHRFFNRCLRPRHGGDDRRLGLSQHHIIYCIVRDCNLLCCIALHTVHSILCYKLQIDYINPLNDRTLPPRLSCSRRVSLESLYGMWLWWSTRAVITRPRVRRL